MAELKAVGVQTVPFELTTDEPVVKTYKNVGQYWKYNKADFLKQPVYSRTFPPCKYCK